LFRNAAVLNADDEDLSRACNVLVDNGRIRDVSDKPIKSNAATGVDVKGRTLMPGVIDCHVHTIASRLNLGLDERLPNVFVTLVVAQTTAARLPITSARRRNVALMADLLGVGYRTARRAGHHENNKFFKNELAA